MAMATDLIRYEGGSPILDERTGARLAALEATIEQLEAERDALRGMIRDEMERIGCIRLQTEELVVSYIPDGTSERLDSKALRAECPDVYDAYAKLTPVKSRVLVRWRHKEAE